MCGIVGAWSLDSSQLDALSSMVNAIRHRGPDDLGYWHDSAVGIQLGHARLSIVDVSSAGHQPMLSHSGRFVLSFNGEIYNHQELRSLLDSTDATRWRGSSDTETVLEAIATWGLLPALEKSVGMYAFALWDRREKKLYLVRDRFGEKPLYYGWQNGTLLFGSELKAIRVHPSFHALIDRDALALYMRYGYVPAPRTIYQGIFKLPPGSYICLREGSGPSTQMPVQYWSLRDKAQEGQLHRFVGTKKDAIDQVERLLARTLTSQRIADVPVGAFLSGGVDSSLVVAMLQAIGNRPVRTFTVGVGDWRYDEAEHAKQIADYLGAEHTEMYIDSRKMLEIVPKIPIIYDEPFGDSSQIPTRLVSEMTRQYVTVSLSGDGGDEVFGGYNRYSWQDRIFRLPYSLRRIAGKSLRLLRPDHWTALYKPVAYLTPKRQRMTMFGDRMHKLSEALESKSMSDYYRQTTSLCTNSTELVPGSSEMGYYASLYNLGDGLVDPESKMMLMDQISYMVDDILCKVDRAAMSVSLETRMPYLDHRLVEFVWTLPTDFKINDGQTKWILRQLLYQYVPRHIIDQPKKGFAVPLDKWLRGPLRDWADSLVEPAKLKREGLLDVDLVQEKWNEHQSGTRNWQSQLWNILMFEQWLSDTAN